MLKCTEKNLAKDKLINRPLRVHVEGNIGAGKSSLLDFLKKKSCIEIHSEPLNKWQDLNGDNIFDLYYSDPEKYAYTFQSYVLLTLAQRNLETSEKPVQVYERSIQSTQQCFLRALNKTKAIDSSMKSILDEYVDFLNNHFNDDSDLIIYVRTTPSTVFDRIKNRGRSEERSIEKKYLTLLNTLHENWIGRQKKGRVFTIDGNLKFEELENEYKNCFHAIEQALYNKEVHEMQEQFMQMTIESNE